MTSPTHIGITTGNRGEVFFTPLGIMLGPDSDRQDRSFRPHWPLGAVALERRRPGQPTATEWMEIHQVYPCEDGEYVLALGRQNDFTSEYAVVGSHGVSDDCAPWTVQHDRELQRQCDQRRTSTGNPAPLPPGYITTPGPITRHAPAGRRRMEDLRPNWPYGAVAAFHPDNSGGSATWMQIDFAAQSDNGWTVTVSHQDGTGTLTFAVDHCGRSDTCWPWTDLDEQALHAPDPWEAAAGPWATDHDYRLPQEPLDLIWGRPGP